MYWHYDGRLKINQSTKKHGAVGKLFVIFSVHNGLYRDGFTMTAINERGGKTNGKLFGIVFDYTHFFPFNNDRLLLEQGSNSN